MPKKLSFEFKRALDLSDTTTKLVLILGLSNILFIFFANPTNVMTIDVVVSQLINLMFLVYILSCFKNGNCNIFACSIALIASFLFAAKLAINISGALATTKHM